MNNKLFKRLLSLVLSLVLVASCLPAGVLTRAGAAAGVAQSESVADPSTFNSWKDTSFNPYNLTTEHAGGVWTDKTVVKADDADAVFVDKNGNPLGITADDNNFLVALSALGANSVVAGQGSTPTDTIFVLDLSNSMESSEINAMVVAANDSIHTLLSANEDSRVGVVVYSTTATTLLPLDRYTPVTDGGDVEYIERYQSSGFFSSTDEIRPARATSGGSTVYVKNGNNENVTSPSVDVDGVTYIQGGLWKAWEQFEAATVSDSRTPVLVLMSDGAPSLATEQYASVPGTATVGGGYTQDVNDGTAFLTQLTAAYVKEKIAEKYGSTAYLYSVGLGINEGDNSVSVAEAVLNTAWEREGIEDYWDSYLGLANATNKTMSVSVRNNRTATVTYNSTLTAASENYVNRYFPAENASQLSAAFEGIVNEISLKASYNVTRLEGNDANSSGYVTFVDEIGTGMQIKDIKGILVGDTLYTGQRLAQALLNQEFGTATNPTTLGDNMVWALKQRLGITETAVVHDLIQQAYDAGQIAYNAQSGEYSNLICWFSDANGDYLGFWDAADPDAAIPAGAAYANASYGMLGTTTDSQTAHASDMMYVAVMVSKQVTEVNGLPALEAKTPELVTFRVPASLLPTVTYQIEVEAASGEQITEQTPAKITYNDAEPIRLVYEVGVHNKLTPENIHEFVREGYQAKDANGNYYLYTNAWYWEPSDGSAADFNTPPTKDNDVGKDVLYDTGKNHITYAYFEPSEQNEHYYYTEDTDLYILNGTTYEKLTTAPVTDGSVKYYFQHKVFESKQPATQTRVAVDAQVNIHYGEVSQKLLENSNNYAVGNDGVYYIKEGTMHYHTIHEHDKGKVSNATGSFQYRLHQLVDIAVDGQNRASHHFEIAYLGNNGRVTYSPAQGFTLNKVMAPNATATGEFIFDVTVSADNDGKYTETVDGVSTEKTMPGNAFTVSLAAGKQVTITGLDVGATYTVTERKSEGYKLGGIVVSSGSFSGTTATGTVEENKIHSVTYTNDIQGYGSLLVSKKVTYNKGVKPQNDPHTFTITVELAGMAEKQVYVNGALTTLDQYGRTDLSLKDGEQALITGIPEGTAYTVTEDLTEGTTNIPYGYTADSGYTVTAGSFNGAIAKDTVATAAVQNAYTPDDVVIDDTDPAITLQVNKRLEVDFDTSEDENDNYKIAAYEFLFLLQRYNATTGQWGPPSHNATITISNPAEPNSQFYGQGNVGSAQINLKDLPFDSVGEHYFRIKEDIPANLNTGWTYDRTHHDFKVVVTDTDLDGKLEISSVEKVDETVTITPTDIDNDTKPDTWAVNAGFTNYYAAMSTKLTFAAKKTLTGATLKDGQFDFVLYKAQYNESTDTFVIPANPTAFPAKNGANGDIVFTTETYPFASGTQHYYYVMKEKTAKGNGVTVDENEWRIKVTVEPDGSKAKVTKVQYKKGTDNYTDASVSATGVFNEIEFKNTYKAAPTSLALSGNKTLTNVTPGAQNSDMTTGIQRGDFGFQFTKISGPGDPNLFKIIGANGVTTSYGVINSTVEDGGNVTFTNPSVNNANIKLYFDEEGTYVFKLVEKEGSESYITYDDSEYLVSVVVTDNGLGQLETAVTYTKDGVPANEIVFNNLYKAAPTGEVRFNANKVLDVLPGFERPLRANDFRVTLTHPDGHKETVYNDVNGIFTFAPLSFDTIGTYTYELKEIVPHGAVNNKYNGVTYDAAVKTFTIEVTDDGSGKLVAKLNGTQELSSTSTQAATVINTYTADSVSIHLTAHKDLVGRDMTENDKFTFKLTALSGAPMPENYEDKQNDETGFVDFGTIKYTAVGTYKYEVTEVVPTGADNNKLDGITYTTMKYEVTVTVTDLGNGKLHAEVSALGDGEAQPGGVIFINVYKAASVTVNIEGDSANTGGKIFTDESSLPANKKDLDDYAFVFKLVEPGVGVIEEVEDNGAGFSFADIEYTQPGEYQYLIYEVPTNKPGVSYDYAKYRVTVTVTDNGEGQLEAEVKYEKASSGETDDYQIVGGVLFENTYKAKETSVTFAGVKTLTGKQLKGNDFSFILKNASGDELETVKNKANGSFSFREITYNAEGTYVYTLEEVKGNAEGVTYDKTKYTITVTVTDVNGELKATTEILKDGKAAEELKFVNSYEAPEEPTEPTEPTPGGEGSATPDEDDPPKTGDESNIGRWTLMMAVSAIGMLAVLVLGKKKLFEQ